MNDSHLFKTDLQNLEQLKQTIPVKQLPKAIQDAILVTRKLGVRYLWVDALCIIQDSKDDWSHEAVRMSSVYRNSLLTIAAIDGPSLGHGIFRARQHRVRPVHSSDGASPYCDDPYLVVSFSEFRRSRPLGELNSRGWALQERLLFLAC